MRWLAIALVLALCGCDPKPPPPSDPATTQTTTAAPAEGPDDVLLRYYAAMAKQQFEAAYAFVHPDDQTARSLDEFRTTAADPLHAALLARRTYEVKAVLITGDRATIELDTTGPDIVKLQRKIAAQIMKEAKGQQDIKALMQVEVAKPDAPTIVTHQKVFAKRGPGGEWRLDFDWDAERLDRPVPTQTRAQTDAGSAAGDQ